MNITIYQWSISENKPWIIKNPKNREVRKGPLNAWKYAWKHENKNKRRDKMVLPALREENDKKIVVNPFQVGERRKVEKPF